MAVTPQHPVEESTPPKPALLARVIGRSRLIVMVAVVAVLATAFSLFLLGAVLAAKGIWNAWAQAVTGDIESTALTVRFLEIVTVMLKAVFFYLIGVGLYSLFISPLNLTVALGVKTLSDLEAKIISVVIVILAVSFMELFIAERGNMTVLISAGALALAVIALVLFQWHAHRAGLDHSDHRPGEVEHAKAELFEHSHERHAPRGPDGASTADQPPASTPSDADTTR
jgi:uncharacterized membrane protein YqhA